MHYQREQHFNTFEDFNSFPHGWDADFSTTSLGAYEVALKQSVSPEMMVNTAWFGAPTIQQGSTPSGMRTFALPLRLHNSYFWRGLAIEPNTFMTFPSDRVLFSMMGTDSEILTMSIDQRLVDSCLENWDIDPDKVFRLPHTTDLSNIEYLALQRSIAITTEFMVKYGSHKVYPHMSRGIQEYLIDNLLRPALNQLKQHRVSPSVASIRIKQAADYIMGHLGEPLTIVEICNHIGCSRRTLEQSFSKHTGTSPRRFIHTTRLNLCRKALLEAVPGEKVKDIASHYGFWHMGQFSADFKAMFGEQPSRYLARKR